VIGLAAGIADGKGKPKPSSYKPHGTSDLFEKNGQVCLGASFAGHGGWATKYHETYVSTNNMQGTIDDSSSETFSWQVGEKTSGAQCPLVFLKGYKPNGGGAVFDTGFIRNGENINDVNSPALQQPVTFKCSKGIIQHSSTGPNDSLKIQVEGGSIVFIATIVVPHVPCVDPNNGDETPGSPDAGDAVEGGHIGGDWFTASSGKVPISLLEHVKSITVNVASDSHTGGQPNCGVQDANVKCSQAGVWQGTFTLTASV
jgi:hypothetical protein